MVRANAKHGFCALVLCAFSSAALAQRAPKSTSQLPPEPLAQLIDSSSPRLLTSDEGMAIIGAALEARHTLRPYGDCSHLVHTIYEQAGFHYHYADSTDLYQGVAEFQQVSHPQPGDLAVWRGHAAIVVNPAQHTFFSSTRSGLRVESYDLAYWKHRGTPRFFRYLKTASPPPLSVTRTSSSTSPNLRSFRSRTPEAKGSEDPPGADDPDNVPTLSSPRRSLLVHAFQPTPQELNDALSLYFSETENSFHSQDLLRLSQPLIIFDRIVVKDVRIKKNQAWVDVKIENLSTLVAGRATPRKRSEQQRWPLTPGNANSWELVFPANTSYLKHDFVVRILARQLATLADHTPQTGDSTNDQAQLARVLNLLLEK